MRRIPFIRGDMNQRLCFACTVVVACFGFAASASAQESLAPSSGAPPARTGFQMALRTGYAVPMGNARGANPGSTGSDLAMSDGFSGQVPIFIEIGGKVIPNLFVGGYLGLGFGGAAGKNNTLLQQRGPRCGKVRPRHGARNPKPISAPPPAQPLVGDRL